SKPRMPSLSNPAIQNPMNRPSTFRLIVPLETPDRIPVFVRYHRGPARHVVPDGFLALEIGEALAYHKGGAARRQVLVRRIEHNAGAVAHGMARRLENLAVE